MRPRRSPGIASLSPPGQTKGPTGSVTAEQFVACSKSTSITLEDEAQRKLHLPFLNRLRDYAEIGSSRIDPWGGVKNGVFVRLNASPRKTRATLGDGRAFRNAAL